MKSDKIDYLKLSVSRILSETDWYVIREADSGEVIPQDVKDKRAALRQLSNDTEAQINALSTKKAVALFDLPIL